MSHEEKNTILQILIGIGINIWLAVEINNLYSKGLMYSPDAIHRWAETIFWIMIISVLMGIIITIFGTLIFSIIESIIFGEADNNLIIDERDREIAGTGHKVFVGFSSTGFLMLILGLKFGFELIDCLVLMMFCFSLGGLLSEIVKLVRYRMSL